MGFLKSLFGKKEEVEEVYSDELEQWFARKSEKKIESLNESLEEHEDDIAEQRKSFEKALAELRKSPISLSKEESLHKEAFIKRAVDFLDKFHFIADSDESKTIGNFSNLEEAYEEFSSASSKHVDEIEDYFQDEIGDMTFAAKNLQSTLENMRPLINDDGGLKELQTIKKELKLISRSNDAKERIGTEVQQQEYLLSKQKEFVQKLEKQLSDLENSKDYRGMEGNKADLSRAEKKLKDDEKTVQDRLSQIEKATRQFSSLTNQNLRLLNMMSNPSDIIQDPTIAEQTFEIIRSILNTEIDTIYRKKALDSLSQLSKSYLENLHAERSVLLAKRRELMFKMRTDRSAREAEDFNYKISHAKNQLKKIESEMEKLGDQKEKINVEKVKAYLGNRLSSFFEKRIVVR